MTTATRTEVTGAEKNARAVAALFEADPRWTVEVTSEEAAPLYFSDGEILADGSISWKVWATGPHGDTFYASWRSSTTGRRRTTFTYGKYGIGYSSKNEIRLRAGNVGHYAQAATS